MNAWFKSAFAATAVPLGVQGGKNANWKFFPKASSHLSHYSNHHRLTQVAARLVDKGINPAWAAFPVSGKAKHGADRRTWVSLRYAERPTEGPTEGPLSKFYFRVLVTCAAKKLSQPRRLSPNSSHDYQNNLYASAFPPQQSSGSANTNMSWDTRSRFTNIKINQPKLKKNYRIVYVRFHIE